MFEGFEHVQVQTSDPECVINLRYGGHGPPVLLLHGNPLTHVTWHLIAPRLAQDFTVVCADLRGYGDSGKPRGKPDHSNYSFRRMAQDQVDVMRHLGFEQFMVAGHDRGARTAYRMALDHPAMVQKLCAIDILPTHHVWTHVTREWSLNSYHWSFMAQPYDFPERLLAGHEEYYIRLKLGSQGLGKGGITEEALQEYVRCCTPEHIHGVCEDYRAAATIDYAMDTADLAGRAQDHLSGARDRRRPEPHEQVLQLRQGLVELRHQPRGLCHAAVRPLSRRAGARRNVRHARRFLPELSRPPSAR